MFTARSHPNFVWRWAFGPLLQENYFGLVSLATVAMVIKTFLQSSIIDYSGAEFRDWSFGQDKLGNTAMPVAMATKKITLDVSHHQRYVTFHCGFITFKELWWQNHPALTRAPREGQGPSNINTGVWWSFGESHDATREVPMDDFQSWEVSGLQQKPVYLHN